MGPEEIAVAMRLKGAAAYQRDMAKSTAATTTFGKSASKAGAEARIGATGIDAMSKSSKTGAGALTRIRKAGEGMKSTGRTMTYGLTLPLAAAGYMSIKVAGDFERSMAQVQVATGASDQEMDLLGDTAKQLGADTKFSAGEAAGAMLELAKSGITPAQIRAGALKSAMDLAAAGNMDLAQAATLTGTSMNAFSLRAEKAKTVADALAGGANASAADVSDLSLALSQGGTSAAAYGLNINESVGALSAFADNAIRGSDAGTSFKTFLTRLNPTTKKSAELMNELGLNFFDAHGQMKKLPAVAQELQDKLGGMTDKQRGAALSVLFGSDAIRAANVFYKEGATGMNKYIGATKKQGAATKMANAFMKGMAGTIEKSKGAMENAALVAGIALAPVITTLANAVAWLSETFSSLPPGVQKAVIIFGLILAVVGPIVWFLGTMTVAITALIPVVGYLAGAFVALDVSMAGIPLLIGAVAAVAVGLSGIFSGSAKKTNLLADTSKRLTKYMEEQRTAGKNLVASEHRLSKAKDRSKNAAASFKKAQGHLNAVIREYGSNSRPAIHAEQRLAEKRWSVVRATKAKERAERQHGIALQMTKHLNRTALLEARHEINLLKMKKGQFDELWVREKKSGASAERLNQIAEWGSKANDKLRKAGKKQNEILLEASQKIGPKYAEWLKHATREMLEFGSEMGVVNHNFERMKGLMEHLETLSVPQVPDTNPFNNSFGLPRAKPGKGGGGNKNTSSSGGGADNTVTLMRTRGGPAPSRLNTRPQGGAGSRRKGKQVPVQVNLHVGRRKFGEAMTMAMIDDEVNQ